MDRILEMIPEGGEARLRGILVLKEEELLAAANTRVKSDIILPPVIACERSLGASSLRYIELVRGHLPSEVVLEAVYLTTLE